MAKLTITGIRLRPPVRRTVETLAEARTESYIPIELQLQNTGRTKTLYFIARPRSIRYDAEAHRLRLSFEEPNPDELIRPGLRNPPRIDSVGPGYETTLIAHVPLVLKTINTKVRVDRAIVETDLSGVESISCRIAYAEAPFSRRLSEPAGEMVRRLYAWGERAELDAPCSLPPADAGYGRPPSPTQRDPYADPE